MPNSERIGHVLSSWAAGRNALLYGPPATGKTRLISELFQALQEPRRSSTGIELDPSSSSSPFSRPQRDIPIPVPAKVVWTTFHQSYGYEDFVLGLRPEVSEGSTTLQPWAGVFLDAALELNDPESEYKSVVIFIDEINRGNAARIFGEFMTFLDFDYRESGTVPLPLPLRQLAYYDDESEPIRRVSGAFARIAEGFTFPKDVYIVATMNSVDRAAVPIDSALARRFDRIEMRPDLSVLEREWGIDASKLGGRDVNSLTPFETAYLVLDKLNMTIASDLGPEFELGHGLLSPMRTKHVDGDGKVVVTSPTEAWRTLAKTWDDVIFPQLEDRYSGRPEQLMELLEVNNSPDNGEYAWQHRASVTGHTTKPIMAPVRVSDLDVDVIQRSFKWLAR